jgi:hypothetical protein
MMELMGLAVAARRVPLAASATGDASKPSTVDRRVTANDPLRRTCAWTEEWLSCIWAFFGVWFYRPVDEGEAVRNQQ